jgi:hypothetical protein
VGYGTKADKLRGKLISLLEFVFVGFAHFHRIKLQPPVSRAGKLAFFPLLRCGCIA